MIKLIRDYLHRYFGYDSQIVAIWSEELEPLIGMEIAQFLKKTYNVEFHIIPHRERFFRVSGDDQSFDQNKYDSTVANIMRNATSDITQRSCIVIPSAGLAANTLPKQLERMHRNKYLVLYPLKTSLIINSNKYNLSINLGGSETFIEIDPYKDGIDPLRSIANATLSIATMASEINKANDSYIEKVIIACLSVSILIGYLLKRLAQSKSRQSTKEPKKNRFDSIREKIAEAKATRVRLQNKFSPQQNEKRSPRLSTDSQNEYQYIPPLVLSKLPSGRIIIKDQKVGEAEKIDTEADQEEPSIKPKYIELQQKKRDALLALLRNNRPATEMLLDFVAGNPQATIIHMSCDNLEKFLLNQLGCTKPDPKKHKRNNHNHINLPDGLSRGSLTPRKDSRLHLSRAPAKPDFIDALRDSLQALDITVECLESLCLEKKLNNRIF